MSDKSLAITCGGTGGHFYPGLTIARHACEHGWSVVLLLSGKKVDEQAAIAAEFDIQTVKLKIMPSPGNLSNAVRFIIGAVFGTLSAIAVLRRFKPDALLGMGSFASLPAVLAAKLLGIPIFLHDGNARIGKANRFFSRWARHLGTAFPPVNGEQVKCACSSVGMPVRPELLDNDCTKEAAVEHLNETYGTVLRPELPTLLIFGGSQGARIFNQTFPEALRGCEEIFFQVIHLTGANEFEAVSALYALAAFPVLCLPSTTEMHLLYRTADVVIARSGGSTVAELCLFGKYAFLIPYPYAAERHQNDNALFLAAAGAAEVIDNAQCTIEKADELINRWLAAPDEFVAAGKRGITLARPAAAEIMLQLIADTSGDVQQ